MRHFDINQWKSYMAQSLDKSQEQQMEQHLLHCDECLQTYISAVEESQQKLAAVGDSQNLTNRIISRIAEDTAAEKNVKKVVRPGMLAYYSAAACITLCLTFTGGFDYMSKGVNSAVSYIASTSKQVEKVIDIEWSDTFKERTSGTFNKFEKR